MKFHIIIPARFESSRLPRKLLLDSSGVPLINHTALRALKIIDSAPELFTGVTVAADDEQIISVVEKIINSTDSRLQAVMTSTSHQSGSDRIAEAVEIAGLNEEIIINLQGDEPEIPVNVVINFANFVAEINDFTMATLAYPLRDAASITNPNLVKVVTASNNNALYFSRSPIPYDRQEADGITSNALGHIGIYAYRQNILRQFVNLPQGILEKKEKLEQLRALENNIPIAVQVLSERVPKGIDTEEDYNDFLTRY